MESKKLTLVSTVHGAYHLYLRGWIDNLRMAGYHLPIHIIVLDEQDVAINDDGVTVEHVPAEKPSWGASDYNKAQKNSSVLLHCIQVDIDIYFTQNPAIYANLPYQFIISRGLGFPPEAIKSWGFSLCTGFYIAKPSALPLLDEWISQQGRRRDLDQEGLNYRLLELGTHWVHSKSSLVTDAFAVSHDKTICALPDRAITRDISFESFGAIHHQSTLNIHKKAGRD